MSKSDEATKKYGAVAVVFCAGVLCEYHLGYGIGWALIVIMLML